MFEFQDGTGVHKVDNPGTFIAIILFMIVLMLALSIGIGYLTLRA